MFVIIRYLVVIAIFSLSTHAMAEILVYDDCEQYPPSDKWAVIIGAVPSGMSITPSNLRSRTGFGSYKVYLPSIPQGLRYNSGANDIHVELQPIVPISPQERRNHKFTFNQTYWVAWSLYIPEDFNFPTQAGRWLLMGQWHNTLDSCDGNSPPPVAFYTNSDTGGVVLYIRGIYDRCLTTGNYDRMMVYNSPALKKGDWNDFVINIRFSYTGGAFTRVWLNGTNFADDRGINCYNDANGLYFRIGQYGNLAVDSTVYYDEIRIGDENSSYAEVFPGGDAHSAIIDDEQPQELELMPPTLTIVN
jgi:hypothetical protein